jgi:hypothetical protein
MSRRLPFDLIPSTSEFIAISQQDYSQMAGKFATPDEEKAIGLIEKKWCDGEGDAEFGIEIPIKFGWTGTETEKLDVVLARERFAKIAGIELIATIAQQKNISPELAGKMLEGMAGNKFVPDELIEFTAEIMSFEERHMAIDGDLLKQTVLMTRAIPAWTQELTQTLPLSVRHKLADLIEIEEMGEVDPKPAAVVAPSPSPSSEPISSSSESTKVLIGVA